ncbi:hypothetical protein M433DRAFT_7145, partial [Acidomyces richmondensis BFW]
MGGHHHPSGSIRRWKSKSTPSATTTTTESTTTAPPSAFTKTTPKRVRERSNPTMAVSSCTTTPQNAGNNTTFLPELYSTPPMPSTFQSKPTTFASSHQPSTLARRPDSDTLPNIPRHIFESPQIGHSIAIDRVEETPPLPPTWTSQHDRAICVLDARNYPLENIVMKLRRTFPALTGTVLTGAMVDKRLRQLDQDVEIDYWRIGLLVPAQQETRAREPTLKA